MFNLIKSYPKWTKDEETFLMNNYNSGIDFLHNYLSHRTKCSIRQRLSKLDLKLRTLLIKNESFFSIPNLINSHIAGFLAGDGNIRDVNGCSVSFTINIKDMDYLKYIKEKTNFTGDIKVKTSSFKIKNYRKNADIIPTYEGIHTTCSLAFHSCHNWIPDLKNNWNLISNKTSRLEPPNLKDLPLQLAFICGNIDADGTIYISKMKNQPHKDNLKVTFLGTHNLLNWIYEIFNKITPKINRYKVKLERPDAKVYMYGITGAKAYFISKMILSLNIYKMARKWQRAEEYIKYIETNFDKLTPKMQNLIKNNISQEIINFVKNTSQEFPQDFLDKIGYKS